MVKKQGAKAEKPPRGDTEILTAEEAAAVLRISKRLLLRLVRGGKVPGQKLGREWRFLRSELRRSLATSPEPGDELIKALEKKGVPFTVTPGGEAKG